MAAAIAAGRGGARTAIIEAQPRIGRKLLSTGNGRCNITNKNISSEYYRTDQPEKLGAILNRYGADEIIRFFSGIGVPVFEEREGRMYPRCETATGVLDMLRFELAGLGVEIITDKRVSDIINKDGMWRVKTAEDGPVYAARTAVLACGSQANPQLGGCADGADIAKRLGIKTVDSRPSLCPLLSSSPLLKTLKGIRVHCRVRLVRRDKIIDTQDGELQFNDGNLSGICVFQLSNRITDDLKDTYIEADYAPYMSAAELSETLRQRRDRLSALPAEDFLSGMLNKRLAAAVLKNAKISPMNKPAGTLTDSELCAIRDNLKAMRFGITGFAGWKQAQTALGGIPLSELTEDLEVRGKPGLFACGESVYCTGDCGGFNLHWAWASGLDAGYAAAGYAAAGTSAAGYAAAGYAAAGYAAANRAPEHAEKPHDKKHDNK